MSRHVFAAIVLGISVCCSSLAGSACLAALPGQAVTLEQADRICGGSSSDLFVMLSMVIPSADHAYELDAEKETFCSSSTYTACTIGGACGTEMENKLKSKGYGNRDRTVDKVCSSTVCGGATVTCGSFKTNGCE